MKQLADAGVERASIVTSGKGMEGDSDFEQIVTLIDYVAKESGIKICANLGTISSTQAELLVQSGIRRYAHNLETSERFYPEICTTHSYSERFSTLLAAKNAGLELCSGGIIGLGESWQDRIDLAFTLRALDVSSVPINILNPIPGTLLEKQSPLSPLEILKTFAIFRFILPDKIIRPAGGREINLRDMQGAIMLAGANGLIVGNYLTFGGRDTAKDFAMVSDAGLYPNSTNFSGGLNL
jgi:biotin synthase